MGKHHVDGPSEGYLRILEYEKQGAALAACNETRLKFPLERYPDYFVVFENVSRDIIYCKAFHNRGMFAFVSKEWVTPFAKWINGRRVLEVMSGAGWLAKALREEGVDIIATDNFRWQKKFGWDVQSDIESLDCLAAIGKYGASCPLLIMSWPPYNTKDAYKIAKQYYKVNPEGLIIYIGEWEGATGDEQFHQHFMKIADPQFNLLNNAFRSWPLKRDKMYLGRFSLNRL